LTGVSPYRHGPQVWIVRGLDALARRQRRVLAATLAWHVALWWAAQADVSWSDPLGYADRAQEIARGWDGFLSQRSIHPFWMRLGIIGPVGMLYRWFGVSVVTTNLWSLVAVLLIVTVAYAAVPTPRGRVIAMVLAGLSGPLAVYGFDLTADLVATGFLALCVEALRRRDDRRGSAWLAGAVVTWCAAFLAKESAVWLAPVWLYVVVVDVRHLGIGRALGRYAAAVAVAACAAATYLWFCDRHWGDPLARFVGIQAVSAEHLWALEGGSRPWRLTIGPVLLLLREHGPALLAAACAPWLVSPRLRLWSIATGVVLAFYWLGSASTSTYLPLPLNGRMILPALPGILVLAAATVDAWIAGWPARPGRRPLMLAAGALAVAAHFAIVVAPLVVRDAPDAGAMAVVRAVVADHPGPVIVVCSDERTGRVASFHFGFRVPPSVAIVVATDFGAGPPPTGARVIVVHHAGRAGYLERAYGAATAASALDALGLPRLYRQHDVQVLDAADGVALHRALE
jgi:hypothetical protein